MLAVRLHGNSDLRVDQVPEPDAVGPGQVRVEPQWCGICGTDLHEYAHGPLYTPAENLPQVIGHEFSAVIAETGPGVTAFRPGDRVAVLPHVFCGSCFYCLRGRQGLCSNLKLTGVTWPWGGLAGQAIVPASQVVALPDGVSFEQGAVLEPLATVVHGVERSGLRPGDSVLVTGGGPIGQLAVLVAAAAGAGSIFLSEPQAARRLMAERNGATVFDPASADVAGEVGELTGGLGADCAIECSGVQAGLDACVASVRRAATVAVIAIHLGDRLVQPEGWVWRDLTVAGVWSFKIWDTPRILAQIAAGTLPVERVVTSRIGMRDVVSQGHRAARRPGRRPGEDPRLGGGEEAAGEEAAGTTGPSRKRRDEQVRREDRAGRRRRPGHGPGLRRAVRRRGREPGPVRHRGGHARDGGGRAAGPRLCRGDGQRRRVPGGRRGGGGRAHRRAVRRDRRPRPHGGRGRADTAARVPGEPVAAHRGREPHRRVPHRQGGRPGHGRPRRRRDRGVRVHQRVLRRRVERALQRDQGRPGDVRPQRRHGSRPAPYPDQRGRPGDHRHPAVPPRSSTTRSPGPTTSSGSRPGATAPPTTSRRWCCSWPRTTPGT